MIESIKTGDCLAIYHRPSKRHKVRIWLGILTDEASIQYLVPVKASKPTGFWKPETDR